MEDGNLQDKLNIVQDERMKLLKENSKLRKDVEMFSKSEETLSGQVKTLEGKVDLLEQEKYSLSMEISSLKCDLSIKETEIKRQSTKLTQLGEIRIAVEDKYTKQKEKLQKILNSEKEFFKALQEVMDYYYDCLIKYSRFNIKCLYKLMVSENMNIQQELKEDFQQKYNTLRILKGDLEIPSVKVNKDAIFKNLQQRVAFFQDIDFDKTQMAFDKLLDEMRVQGVKIEVNDMNIFVDSKQGAKLQTRGSIMGNSFNEDLNDSMNDLNTSQTMFLQDLDKDTASTATNVGGFATLSDHFGSIKAQIQAKISETQLPDYENIQKILEEVNGFVDFINTNVDLGQNEKKVAQVDQTPRNSGAKAAGFGAQIDGILNQIEPKADTATVKEIVGSKQSS